MLKLGVIIKNTAMNRARKNENSPRTSPPTPPSKPHTGPTTLSNIEKKVYQGLIANPDIVDNSISKKIGVTRQSVTKIRRRLQSEGLLLTAKLPDLEALGSQIVAFAHYRLKEGANLQTPPPTSVCGSVPNFAHPFLLGEVCEAQEGPR